jgi:hypothetical protein
LDSEHTSALWKYAISISGSGPSRGLLGSNDSKKDLRQSLSMLMKKRPLVVSAIPKRVKEVQEKFQKVDVSPGAFMRKVEKDMEFNICKVQVNPLLIFLHIDQGFITDNLGRFTPFASPVANSRSMHKEQVEKVCIEILERKLVVACEDFAIVPFGVSTDQPPLVEHLEYRCTLDRDTTSRNTVKTKRATLLTTECFATFYKEVSAPHRGFVQPGKNGCSLWHLDLIYFCFHRFGD